MDDRSYLLQVVRQAKVGDITLKGHETPGHMAGSSNRRRNPVRTCRRRLGMNDSDVWCPLADRPEEMLIHFIMKLGIIDFLAFKGVCKPWRSAALSDPSDFLQRKEPLFFTLLRKEYTFTDIFNERSYKTLLGNSSSGSCVGVSCGYLIIRREKRSPELYLVNPITRHELYFPPLPQNTRFAEFRAILVHSSLLSRSIVIILYRQHNQSQVLFSGSGGDSEWVTYPISGEGRDIVDLTFFKGNIYVLSKDGRIGEMKLDHLPRLQLFDLQRMPSARRELVSSDERLFMVSHPSWENWRNPVVKHEFDFVNMEWILREDLGEHCLFLNKVSSSAVIDTTKWIGRDKLSPFSSTYSRPEYGREIWYFPHESHNVNLLTDF